jgi:hypothetical protein
LLLPPSLFPFGAAFRRAAALTVRFERRFDARFFLGRQRRRVVFDGLDDLPARRGIANVLPIFCQATVPSRIRHGA